MSKKSSTFASAFAKNEGVFCEILKEVRMATPKKWVLRISELRR